MAGLITAGVFIAAFGLFAAVLTWALRDKLLLRRRVSGLKRQEGTEQSRSPRRRRQGLRLPRIPQQRLVQLENELSAANIMLRAEEFITAWLGLTLLLPGLAYFLGADVIVYAALLIICSVGPIALVMLSKRRRMAKLDGQLADAVNIMCGALRAGFSLQKAMETISLEMPDPIAREFGRVARECQLGMALELSFERLIQRTRNRDLELICSAVLIQRQVGGNLAEVLDNVAETVRQRLKIKGDIKVLTSAGTLSGYIIGLLPVFLLLILMLLNPEYVEVFFTTAKGRSLLLVAAGLEIVGFFFMRRIVMVKM